MVRGVKNLGKPTGFRQSFSMPEGKLARRGLRGVALFCASLAVLFALLTFIGWISGLQLLASVRARYIPMAPSTALCFSLLGIGIVLHLERPARRWVPRLLAAVVLIMAVAKLVEFLSDLHFGIDAWFVRNPEMFGDVPTGRMAPMTALDLVFIALGLIALTRPGAAKWAGPLGVLATIISAVVLVGYWYGTPLLYGGTIIPVALSTAWGFFLCGIAIVAAAGADEWPLRSFLGDSTRAVLLRAFVPVIIIAALLNGWIGSTLLKQMRTNPAVISALGAADASTGRKWRATARKRNWSPSMHSSSSACRSGLGSCAKRISRWKRNCRWHANFKSLCCRNGFQLSRLARPTRRALCVFSACTFPPAT